MKKNFLSVIALLMAAASLAAAAVLWNMVGQYEARLDALESRLGSQPASQSEISLTASQRNDGTADVVLTGKDNLSGAVLKILLDGTVIAQADCLPADDGFTATATLTPVNGCSYVLIRGSEETVLASPDSGSYPALVNLADSLEAYCNLVLGDWIIVDGTLTLDACHLQVQAPLLGAKPLPDSQDVRVMLKHRGDLLEEVAVTLGPGEGEASFEGTLTGVSMALPALDEGEEIGLWMEAVLSDGQVLSACAGTWTVAGSGYEMAAG